MTHMFHHIVHYIFGGSIALLLVAWGVFNNLVLVNGQPLYIVLVAIWVAYTLVAEAFMMKHDKEMM